MNIASGRPVQFPPTAMIARPFTRDGKFRHLLAAEVAQLEEFESGEDPITTVDLPQGQLIRAHVVELGDEEMPRWAINPRHKAKEPQASPFLVLAEGDERAFVDHFTFEIVRQGSRYLLTQAYPGSYVPPLPWMVSAERADGGRAACVAFWDEHAFIASPSILDSLTDEVPSWALADDDAEVVN